MNKSKLLKIGLPAMSVSAAIASIQSAAADKQDKRKPKQLIPEILEAPESFLHDPHYGPLAQSIIDERDHVEPEPVDYCMWGEGIDAGAISQIENACRVPQAVAAALMPDAHLGYGLPIGGVLATRGVVIPYAVGVDIACRMRLSITDLDPDLVHENDPVRCHALDHALQEGTLFGTGGKFRRPHQHDVMDQDWTVSGVTRENKDRAWRQLGSSGSGNHFVEWGVIDLTDNELGLPAGRYVGLLSHSGSRGTGAAVCQRYSTIARQKLPARYHDDKGLSHLAWLDLSEQEGQEYWAAMNLMGEYAAANHQVIHRRVLKLAGAEALTVVENHHNFAWKEHHQGQEVVVHRKGATPAGDGALGVIPGSMATPAFIVRGKGQANSLDSASHGAGRCMSRKAAKSKFNWGSWRDHLRHKNVRLLAGGLDEVPGAYKDIHQVMSAQEDLVDVLGSFQPRIVMMCGDGSRPED